MFSPVWRSDLRLPAASSEVQGRVRGCSVRVGREQSVWACRGLTSIHMQVGHACLGVGSTTLVSATLLCPLSLNSLDWAVLRKRLPAGQTGRAPLRPSGSIPGNGRRSAQNQEGWRKNYDLLCCQHCGRFHTAGRELELWDFTVWVQCGIGQQVRRRFDIREGQEHVVSGDTARSARAITVTVPRRVVRADQIARFNSAQFAQRAAGACEQLASGSSPSSTLARRVMDPVCQCSSCRP